MKEFKVTVKKEETSKDGEKTVVEQEVEIVPIKIQKGKGKGGEYLAPKNISTLDLEFLLKLFPKQEIINKLIRPKFKQFCATITNEAAEEGGRITPARAKKILKDDGKVVQPCGIQDEEKFYDAYSRMFSTLSPRGESNVGLARQQNELLAEFGDLDESASDYETRAMAILREIKKVRDAMAAKKADDSEESGSSEEEDKEAVAA